MAEYSNLIRKIENRYNPELIREVNERSIQSLVGIDRDVAKYIKLAMNEVDQIYTQKTLDAGDNARIHLANSLKYNVDFRCQGSVMTRTHIRGVSDIDLITITGKFNGTDYNRAKRFVENNQYSYRADVQRVREWIENFNAYYGDTNHDLLLLRCDAERVLKSIYDICDTSKPKAIRIKNQHLHRDVDVVIAAWHDSLEYIAYDEETYRGIKIYDKELNTRIGPDFPFLSIDRINKRSSLTGGRLKKMIRFLKNIKADSTQCIDLSSFDINAICYDISIDEYKNLYYLDLVRILYLKLCVLLNNESQRNELKSVDGSEYIFMGKNNKIGGLRVLKEEVEKIYNEL